MFSLHVGVDVCPANSRLNDDFLDREKVFLLHRAAPLFVWSRTDLRTNVVDMNTHGSRKFEKPRAYPV
jgi:hypothetical protein